MLLGMVCSPRQEMTMKLALHKKCPHCGTINDLGTVAYKTIPLCFHCKKALYKTYARFLNLYNNLA
jgi:phage FluMu protein Com